jgi:hypothetical protein
VINEGGNKMKGTEKQIAWANDIKERVMKYHNWVKDNVVDQVEFLETQLPNVPVVLEQMNAALNNDDAKFWIDNFKNVEDGTLNGLYDYLIGMKNVLEFDHFSKRNVFDKIARNADKVWMAKRS